MPIVLDPCRIICAYGVHSGELFRHLDGKFVFAAACRIASANLAVSAGFHEVDETDDLFRLDLILGGLVASYRSDWRAQGYDVFVTGAGLAVVQNSCCKLLFRTKPRECIVPWKAIVTSCLHLHF